MTLPAKPTATANNQTVTAGASIPLTTLFSYSAASGDSITGFDVEANTSNGGYLTLNGVRQQSGVLFPSGTGFLPISQIGQWAFVAGPGGVSDTVGFNASDPSLQFSASVHATVTGQATAVSSVPDTLRAFTDATPGSPIDSDVVQAARSYIGSRWVNTNCTGLVWAISASVGAIFFDFSKSIPVAGQAVSDQGYIVPHSSTTRVDAVVGKWDTVAITSNWQSVVQAGDLVRLYYTTDPTRPNTDEYSFDPLNKIVAWAHSFVVTGKDASGNWLVVDDTINPSNPTASNNGGGFITVTEHAFNPDKTKLGSLLLNPAIAFVDRLISTPAATSADQVHQGTGTSNVLTTVAPVSGTIDAEPMALDIGIAMSDGAGGYIDKDWYQVNLDKGKIYTFSGSSVSINTGRVAISLYGQNGTQVQTAIDAANPSFRFDTTNQIAATQIYYLAASAGGDGSTWKTATGAYTVSLSAVANANVADIIPGSADSRIPLPIGTTYGTIDSTDVNGGSDSDYYKVTLNGGEKYSFIASADVSAADTLDSITIQLRDSNGNALSPIDKTASGGNPTIIYTVPASGAQTYFLAVAASR